MAEPVQQRPAQQDRNAAGAGMDVDLVDAGALHIRRVENQLAQRALADLHAVQLEQPADHIDVADVRHGEQATRRLTQHRGDHRLGDEVLCPPNLDFAVQRRAAMH